MVYFNSLSLKSIQLGNLSATIKALVSGKALMGLARRIKVHKEMQHLQNLEDHMLTDIGLVRSDLEWAMGQSEQMDPLHALQERREESLRLEHLAVVKAYCKAATRET